MKLTRIIAYVFSSVLLIACLDEPDLPENDFKPTVSGKIVGIDQFKDLRVFDISTKEIDFYGDAEYECRPIWSYDGTRFATFKFKQSSKLADTIKIVDTQKNTIKLWEIEDRSGDLTWSSDGTIIAYLGENAKCLKYINTETGKITEIPLILPDSLWASAISWHPDGYQIAIWTKLIETGWTFTQTHYLYMINPYESDLDSIVPKLNFTTKSLFRMEHIDWSLDGKMLLLSSHQEEIYVYNAEENRIHEIPNIIGHSACWSKEGGYILYSRWRWTSMHNAVNDLHITDADGSFDYIFKKNYDSNLIDWY